VGEVALFIFLNKSLNLSRTGIVGVNRSRILQRGILWLNACLD
jgi:hypothetical protein